MAKPDGSSTLCGGSQIAMRLLLIKAMSEGLAAEVKLLEEQLMIHGELTPLQHELALTGLAMLKNSVGLILDKPELPESIKDQSPLGAGEEWALNEDLTAVARSINALHGTLSCNAPPNAVTRIDAVTHSHQD